MQSVETGRLGSQNHLNQRAPKEAPRPRGFGFLMAMAGVGGRAVAVKDTNGE